MSAGKRSAIYARLYALTTVAMGVGPLITAGIFLVRPGLLEQQQEPLQPWPGRLPLCLAVMLLERPSQCRKRRYSGTAGTCLSWRT